MKKSLRTLVNRIHMPSRYLKGMWWLLFLSISHINLSHASIQITDIAGRNITLDAPAQRIILGEGRFLAVLGVLGVNRPLDRVVGMMNDFKQFDPAGYQAYQTAFPEIDQIPTFGQTSETSVSVEKILQLKPEVAIFGLDGHGPGAKSKDILEILSAVGVKVVFIDFRQNPIQHTARSVEIVGQVLGYSDAALAFSQDYQQRLNHIRTTLADVPQSAYPKVLLDVWASTKQPCCFTIAEGLFADMALFAGGISIAKGQLPGPVGKISAEAALISGFDIYIGTYSGALTSNQTTHNQPTHYNSLILGAQVPYDNAQQSLKTVLNGRHFSHLSPVTSGRSYALWHHFYNSPLNLYAIESMAKWFHPDRFQSLNPENTLTELLKGFAPVDLKGTYSATLPPQPNPQR